MKTTAISIIRSFTIYSFLTFSYILLVSSISYGQTNDLKLDNKERLELIETCERQMNRIDTIKNWSNTSDVKAWNKKYPSHLNFFEKGNTQMYELISTTAITQNTTHFYLVDNELVGMKTAVLRFNRPLGYDSLTMVKNKDSEFHDISKSKKASTKEYVYRKTVLKGIYPNGKTIDAIVPRSSTLEIWKRIQKTLNDSTTK